MNFINQSSGYAKSLRTSLSTGRTRASSSKQNILNDISSMIGRLDKLQEQINLRQRETTEQIQVYKSMDKENITNNSNNVQDRVKLADICRGRSTNKQNQNTANFGPNMIRKIKKIKLNMKHYIKLNYIPSPLQTDRTGPTQGRTMATLQGNMTSRSDISRKSMCDKFVGNAIKYNPNSRLQVFPLSPNSKRSPKYWSKVFSVYKKDKVLAKQITFRGLKEFQIRRNQIPSVSNYTRKLIKFAEDLNEFIK
ncbi:hypothetical protein pb186bvf_009975 [Paramecium bursaria]